MAGLYEMLFGNLPPPRHPSSRGAMLGARYRDMPDMTAPIEDQRGADVEKLPDLPLTGQAAENWNILSRYPLGSHVYSSDVYNWLQAHAGTLAPNEHSLTLPADTPPVTYAPGWKPTWMQPGPMPTGPRSGPQFSPLNVSDALNYWRGGMQ